MKYHLEFILQGLPKRTNNNTGAWQGRMAEARKWKTLVFNHIFANRLRPIVPLYKASIIYTRCSSKRPDHDGLVSSFKHVQDGLIEALVIADDRYENIGEPKYLWEKTGRGQGFIKVEVIEINFN